MSNSNCTALVWKNLLTQNVIVHRKSLKVTLAPVTAKSRSERGRAHSLARSKFSLPVAASIFCSVAPSLPSCHQPRRQLYRSRCLPPTPPPPWLLPAKTLRCSWLLRFVRLRSMPTSSTNVDNSATSVPRTSRCTWSLTSGRLALTVSTSSTLARPGAFGDAAAGKRANRNFSQSRNFAEKSPI